LLEKRHSFRISGAKSRALAAYHTGMYRANRQPELPDFHPPFGGKLDPENRWGKLAKNQKTSLRNPLNFRISWSRLTDSNR
jgi:hypothetical protein